MRATTDLRLDWVSEQKKGISGKTDEIGTVSNLVISNVVGLIF